MSERPEPPYRWEAFVHWGNLGVVTAIGVAGAVIDPTLWVALVPAEAALLWAVPDLPPFRRAVDEKHRQLRLRAERQLYLAQLWGLAPERRGPGDWLRELFVVREVDDLDARVVHRGPDFQQYLELRDIVRKLAAIATLASSRITAADIARLEDAVNGYLRVLVAIRPVARALATIDPRAVDEELADVGAKLERADASARPALVERQRLLAARKARYPRLEATLGLLRSRAEAIPEQVRNLHGQVLTDPAKDLQSALDEMVERRELLADALADLDTDAPLRELASPGPVPALPRPSATRAARRDAETRRR
jgi:hypothetical protein